MAALITNAGERDTHTASRDGRCAARRTRALPLPARTLCRFDDGTVFAFRRGPDLFRARDNVLWAHESEGLLLSARSCTPLLRHIGSVYFDVTDHRPLYYERAG
jgi:hypothetical protein